MLLSRLWFKCRKSDTKIIDPTLYPVSEIDRNCPIRLNYNCELQLLVENSWSPHQWVSTVVDVQTSDRHRIDVCRRRVDVNPISKGYPPPRELCIWRHKKSFQYVTIISDVKKFMTSWTKNAHLLVNLIKETHSFAIKLDNFTLLSYIYVNIACYCLWICVKTIGKRSFHKCNYCVIAWYPGRRQLLRPTGVGFNCCPRGVVGHGSSTDVWDNI